MAHHGGDRAVAEGAGEPEDVPDVVEHTERPQIVVEGDGCAVGPAVASQIRGDDVKPHLGERQHDLSPTIRQLRKPVQEQDARSIGRFESRLQQVHRDAVAIVHEAGAYPSGKGGFAVSHVGIPHRHGTPPNAMCTRCVTVLSLMSSTPAACPGERNPRSLTPLIPAVLSLLVTWPVVSVRSDYITT